jgi:hypothetical protein
MLKGTMNFMMIVLTILIVIGVIAMIWRGFVREDQELAARPTGTEMLSTAMRRDGLAMTEFGEEFVPDSQTDKRPDSQIEGQTNSQTDSQTDNQIDNQIDNQTDSHPPVSETSITDVEDAPIEAESQPLDVSLQQMEQTEAAVQDALFRDLQQQLTDTASILDQVEQYVLTLQAIEPFQQEWQHLLTASVSASASASASADAIPDSSLIRE